MDEVHLEVEELALDGVLRRSVEVELKRLVVIGLAIGARVGHPTIVVLGETRGPGPILVWVDS